MASRVRLRQLTKEVAKFRGASPVADVGCSNGYVTNCLSEICNGNVYGFDYLQELVDSARSAHPHIEFRRVDLNRKVKWGQTFELVCCFETLEHVGNLPSALSNVFAAVGDGGTLIISVPVETGSWGLAKHRARTLQARIAEELEAAGVQVVAR